MAWESRAWKLRSSKGYWDPKGALGKIQVFEIKAATSHPPPSLGAQRRGHRVVSTPQCDHNSDLGSHSCHPITLTVIHLLKKSLVWLGWWKWSLESLEGSSGSSTSWEPQKFWSISARMHTGQPAAVTGSLWPNRVLGGFLRAPKNPKGFVFVLQFLYPVVSPVPSWPFRPSLNQVSADTNCLTGY